MCAETFCLICRKDGLVVTINILGETQRYQGLQTSVKFCLTQGQVECSF